LKFKRKQDEGVAQAFDLVKLLGEARLLLNECQRSIAVMQELDETINEMRKEVHLLQSEIQSALQASGLINVKMYKAPLKPDMRPEPAVFDEEYTQRLDDGMVT